MTKWGKYICISTVKHQLRVARATCARLTPSHHLSPYPPWPRGGFNARCTVPARQLCAGSTHTRKSVDNTSRPCSLHSTVALQVCLRKTHTLSQQQCLRSTCMKRSLASPAEHPALLCMKVALRQLSKKFHSEVC